MLACGDTHCSDISEIVQQQYLHTKYKNKFTDINGISYSHGNLQIFCTVLSLVFSYVLLLFYETSKLCDVIKLYYCLILPSVIVYFGALITWIIFCVLQNNDQTEEVQQLQRFSYSKGLTPIRDAYSSNVYSFKKAEKVEDKICTKSNLTAPHDPMNLPASTTQPAEHYTQDYNFKNTLIKKIVGESDLKLKEDQLLLLHVCFCDHWILNKYLMKWIFKKEKRKLRNHKIPVEKITKVAVKNISYSSESGKKNKHSIVLNEIFVRKHSFNESEIESVSKSSSSNLTASQTHTKEYKNSRNLLNVKYLNSYNESIQNFVRLNHSNNDDSEKMYKRRKKLKKYIYKRYIILWTPIINILKLKFLVNNELNVKQTVFKRLLMKSKIKQCHIENKKDFQEVLSMDIFPLTAQKKKDNKNKRNLHLYYKNKDKLKGKQFTSMFDKRTFKRKSKQMLSFNLTSTILPGIKELSVDLANDENSSITTKQKILNCLKNIVPRIQCKSINEKYKFITQSNKNIPQLNKNNGMDNNKTSLSTLSLDFMVVPHTITQAKTITKVKNTNENKKIQLSCKLNEILQYKKQKNMLITHVNNLNENLRNKGKFIHGGKQYRVNNHYWENSRGRKDILHTESQTKHTKKINKVINLKINNKIWLKKLQKPIISQYLVIESKRENDMIHSLMKNKSKQSSILHNIFNVKTFNGTNSRFNSFSVYNAESVLGCSKILPTVTDEYEYHYSMDVINPNILSKSPKTSHSFTRVLKTSNKKSNCCTRSRRSESRKRTSLKRYLMSKLTKKSVKIGADKMTEGFPIDDKKSLDSNKINDKKQIIRKQLLHLINKVFAVQLGDNYIDQSESVISLPLRFKHSRSIGNTRNVCTQGTSIIAKNLRNNSSSDLIFKSSNSLAVDMFEPPAPHPSAASFRSSKFCSTTEYGHLTHLMYNMKRKTTKPRIESKLKGLKSTDGKGADNEANLFDKGFGPMFARANRKSPELEMINWNYERILGIVPNRYMENNEATLLRDVINSAKGSKTYQGPYAGMDLTSEALELTWGNAPKGKACACPYDYCNCSGNSLQNTQTTPASCLGTRDIDGGIRKFLNFLGCAGCGFRRNKSNSTFPQKLIETVEKEKNLEAIRKDGQHAPPEYCLTGCHPYYNNSIRLTESIDEPGIQGIKTSSQMMHEQELEEERLIEETVIKITDEELQSELGLTDENMNELKNTRIEMAQNQDCKSCKDEQELKKLLKQLKKHKVQRFNIEQSKEIRRIIYGSRSYSDLESMYRLDRMLKRPKQKYILESLGTIENPAQKRLFPSIFYRKYNSMKRLT